MLAVMPQAERDSPLLQPGAEVLGAIDGVEHGNPVAEGAHPGPIGLFADEFQLWQCFAQIFLDHRLKVCIGFCNRATVRLPMDLVAASLDLGHESEDEVANAFENGADRDRHVVGHAFLWVYAHLSDNHAMSETRGGVVDVNGRFPLAPTRPFRSSG